VVAAAGHLEAERIEFFVAYPDTLATFVFR
jgi:hypothetical protein